MTLKFTNDANMELAHRAKKHLEWALDFVKRDKMNYAYDQYGIASAYLELYQESTLSYPDETRELSRKLYEELYIKPYENVIEDDTDEG